jgi:hypothetical protein
MQGRKEAEKIATLSAVFLNLNKDGQERVIMLLKTLKFAQENANSKRSTKKGI